MLKLAKLAIAATLAAAPGYAANFFPLDFGNTWTYRHHPTGAAFTVRVGTPVLVNEKVYWTLHGFVDSNILARVDEHDTLVYIDNDTGLEAPFLSFVPADGWLKAPFRACEQESQAQEKRGAYSGPTGEFRDVLEVRYRSTSCADAGTELEQFAENIGMLRRVDQTIAGPRQYDLVYARIGAAIYNPQPNGSFSVTVNDPDGAGGITALLRLSLKGLPVKLVFPTAQEFDAVLRDEDGNTVWTWSEGRLFDQAVHEKTVSFEWTAAVPVPRPGQPSAPPEPKNYTLHAWLATDGPAPRYAATVPVTIYGPAAAN